MQKNMQSETEQNHGELIVMREALVMVLMGM